MQLADLVGELEQIAPTRYAESWDNVGLLVGDPQQDISAVMLTIDYTSEVACEAAGAKCDAIIAYHPPIFDGLKRITSASLLHPPPTERHTTGACSSRTRAPFGST